MNDIEYDYVSKDELIERHKAQATMIRNLKMVLDHESKENERLKLIVRSFEHVRQ